MGGIAVDARIIMGTDVYILETERLSMRRFTLDDLEELIAHRTEPDVARFLGGLEVQTPEFIESRLNFYISCYESHGFGMCAMSRRDTDEMIGVSGIQPLEDTGEIEVGYSIGKSSWGKGIATECALAWLDYGFSETGLERIVAVAHPGNRASIRVMEKLGMTFEKSSWSYGMPVVQYAVSKSDHLAFLESRVATPGA